MFKARDHLIKDDLFLDALSMVMAQVLPRMETERKLATSEAALRESAEHYRSLFNVLHGLPARSIDALA